MPIRLALVEDDPRLRAEYGAIVAGDPEIGLVGAYSSGEEAMAHLPGLAPDAVLMDINLPGMTGIECVRQLKNVLPSVQVVMLTALGDSETVFESLKAGATGYVLKEATGGEVLDAVREVCAGARRSRAPSPASWCSTSRRGEKRRKYRP
ncbi:MAG: response regulator transcription factor [Vicinamibacterales bacterium]